MQGLVRRSLRPVTAVMVCGALLAACSASKSSAKTPGVGASTTTASPVGNPWDKTVADAIADLQDYWAQAMPELYGKPYQKVSGGFYPYTSRSPLPPCGTPPPSYKEIADNAFYCRPADLVAWDNEGLLPGLYKQFGLFTIAIVFAHEWGHAIQQRVGVTGPTILLEQQADCFAGAWVASVANGHSTRFQLTLSNLDAALAGYLQLRDSPDTLSVDPQAHGTGFDRMAAFQEGFLSGAKPCTDYAAHPRAVLELPQSANPSAATTSLPPDQIEKAAIQDLEDYWSKAAAAGGTTWKPVATKPYDPAGTIPTCGARTFQPAEVTKTAFYCIDDDYAAWDEANLMPGVYSQVGGFAVAAVIAKQYSLAALIRDGVSQANPKQFNLEADCLTGTWTASLIRHDRPSQAITLAPEDVDQVLIAFLGFGNGPQALQASTGDEGSPFERVAAFRDGVLHGVTQCATYAHGGGPGL